MPGTKANHGSFSSTVLLPFRAMVSKPARRSYLGIAFFFIVSCGLFGLSIISYWFFYSNFIPQISIERPVYLQYGNGNPSGTASLGPELAHSQHYDVTVILSLPSTPSNRAAGNFMVDLAYLWKQDGVDPNDRSNIAMESRRPASLTYTSPMVDTARRLWRLPLYILGWKVEAEQLRIKMHSVIVPQNINIPPILRLELHSQNHPIQVYSAAVKLDAEFTGLRWIMYNWRITSFLMFSSAFWVFSMMVTCTVWAILAYPGSGSSSGGVKSIKKESLSDDDEWEDSSHSEEPGTGASGESTPKRSQSPSPLLKDVKKEEDLEETTAIDPLIPDTETE